MRNTAGPILRYSHLVAILIADQAAEVTAWLTNAFNLGKSVSKGAS